MLTDDDIRSIWNGMGSFLDDREADRLSFARAVEQAAYAAVIRAAKEREGDALLRSQMRGCIALVESLMTQEQPT